jgi:lipid-A-disaccharide synthase
MGLSAANAMPSAERRRIMIVAGEASGDLHGAELARALVALDPSCELIGIAGKHMRAAGIKALFRCEDITAAGLGELAGSLGRNLKAFFVLRALLREQPPSLLIVIDFPDFNMRLAAVAKRRGVPVLYYIAPQVWAWRRGRARKLAAISDRMAVIFPFEPEIFANAGASVEFVGHPLLDCIKMPPYDREQTLARHGFAPGTKLLALLPGSREREIRYLLRPMVEAARVLQKHYDFKLCLILAPTLTLEQLHVEGRVDLNGIAIVEHDGYNVVAVSELALVASGTATLETALLGCPMVIAYKMSTLTYYLLRLLVRRDMRFIGMPNILAGRQIVPELIQHEVTTSNLIRAAHELMAQPKHDQTRSALREIRQMLGAPGAARRVAEMAFAMMR